MRSPTSFKQEIKRVILAAIARDGSAILDVLVASLELGTGFRKDTIMEIIRNMEITGLVRIQDGTVFAGKPGSGPEKVAGNPSPDYTLSKV